MKTEHRYGVGGVRADRLTCACGHVELFDGDAELPAAVERLNAHIRSTYTDGTTGEVTPAEGDKS